MCYLVKYNNTKYLYNSQSFQYNSKTLLYHKGFTVLNERIKELRIASGMNQVELAKKLGVSKQSISNWENDNIQPSIEMLLKIARIFSVSTDYLLDTGEHTYLDVSNLTHTQLQHIQQIINDISEAQNLTEKKDSN